MLSAARNKFFRHLVLESLSRGRHGELRLLMPGGASRLFGGLSKELQAEITVKDDAFYSSCVLFGAIGFSESYLRGERDTPNLTHAIAWFILNGDYLSGVHTQKQNAGKFDLLGVLNRLQHLLRPNSKKRSRDNISDHYDLGNDFFKLWLDPTMTYSSAYYTTPTDTLEQAQHAKWDQLCKKLRIGPHDYVLEIGCGWGGFAKLVPL